MRQSNLFSTLTVRIFNRRRFRMFRRLSECKAAFLKKKQLSMKLARAPLSIAPRMSAAF